MGKESTKLNLQWVSETIGEQYKEWNEGDIVLIEAQTGTGKSHFVKSILVPYSFERDKKILYICNRKNLKRQVKIDIANIQGIALPEEIDNIRVIGNTTIVSYHSIQNYLLNIRYGKPNKISYSDYDYIVMDECHYIIQDASFNNTTAFFFNDFLKQHNSKAITLFISATMEDIQEHIINYYNEIENSKAWNYSTGTDYKYITAYYYKKIKDIVNTINNDNSGNKWLLFISNVKQGIKLLDEIKESKFICSESSEYKNKMDLEELHNVIYESKFNCKCLIATKTIDNGINIKDDKLTNIIIQSWNRVDFIQMLGRKRIDLNNIQETNLYIPSKCISSFRTMLQKNIKQKENMIELFHSDINQFNRNYDTDIKKLSQYNELFYRNKNTGEWELNETGLIILNKQKALFENMVSDFKIFKNTAYILEQLSWINVEYDENNWIEEVLDNSMVQTLEDYLEELEINKVKLFEDKQKELKDFISKDFDQMVNKLQGCHSKREAGMKILNKLLVSCDISYIIVSKEEKSKKELNYGKRYWLVTKINKDDDEELDYFEYEEL